jgi:hypothetical protein
VVTQGENEVIAHQPNGVLQTFDTMHVETVVVFRWPNTSRLSCGDAGHRCTRRSQGMRDRCFLGGSDRQRQLIECGHHLQDRCFVNAELVVAATDILGERVPGNDDPAP